MNECSGEAQCDGYDPYLGRPDRWYYAVVLLNETAVAAIPAPQQPFRRQAVSAHELGHSIVLRHDFRGDPEILDGTCGLGVLPVTIMDNDCIFGQQVNAPQPWDACGINHGYFDPAWGWGGC